MIDEDMATPPNRYANAAPITIMNIRALPLGVEPTIGVTRRAWKLIYSILTKWLYGKQISRVRKANQEEKFDSVEELSRQIENDCIMAAYHREHSTMMRILQTK